MRQIRPPGYKNEKSALGAPFSIFHWQSFSIAGLSWKDPLLCGPESPQVCHVVLTNTI